MKKPNTKLITVLTALSMFLCACPGTVLLMQGLSDAANAMNRYFSIGELTNNETINLLLNIGSICLSGLILLVPLGLIIYLLIRRGQKTPLQPLEPTGISEDEPIPPTH